MRAATGTLKTSVMNYAKSVKTFTRDQIMAELGLTSNQFTIALNVLKTSGHIKAYHGLYTWNSEAGKLQKQLTNQEKVWKAMQINPRFTVQDIARQSGVRDAYVCSAIRYYLRHQLIEQAGMTTTLDDHPAKVWMLTVKGREKATQPDLNLSTLPDDLVDMSVKLNFLICSGTATSKDHDRTTALALCTKIRKELSKSGGKNGK